jgi:iron(III) transport system ATP-binding protein
MTNLPHMTMQTISPIPNLDLTKAGATLTFDGISRQFGGLHAVRNVDLELSPGEILCLLGPSGCGKTTLLRIAAGLERQNNGRVLIDGEEIAGPKRFVPPEERGIGLMFQDFALFPHLTVADNVAFGLSGGPRSDDSTRVFVALDRVGLSGLADAYPHTLSGGEQQRAALARAMAPRPRVLLMDEPFSGLDRSLRQSVRDDTLTILKENGASSILVTHDPEEAMTTADRIVLMRSGCLAQVGAPGELYNHPVDAEAMRFFSEVNEFQSVVVMGEVQTPLGSYSCVDIAGGTEVVVLIRVHEIGISTSQNGVAAQLIRTRFIGEFTQIDAVLGESGDPIRLCVPGLFECPEGGVVHVETKPEAAHVFVAG